MASKLERATLVAPAIIAIAVSAFDITGMLDTIPFIGNRIPQISLILLALFIAYWAFKEPLTSQDLESHLRKFMTETLSALGQPGVEVIRLPEAEQLYSYVADKIRHANTKVQDITWGSRSAYRTTQQEVAYKGYLHAMQEACNKPNLTYWEVSSLSGRHYYQRALDLINKHYLSYNLGYYDIRKSGIPMLSYIIIDSNELIGWFYTDPRESLDEELYVIIKNAYLIRIFSDYFQSLWNNSRKLKNGNTVNWAALDEIAKTLESEQAT